MISPLSQLAASINADAVGIPKITGSDATFNAIVGIVYTAIGAVAIIFIIKAAFQMVAQGSDPTAVKNARQTILYAIVALVGSTVVFGIIQFVIKAIS